MYAERQSKDKTSWQLGLNRSVVYPRGGLHVGAHSKHTGHPIKTHENGYFFFVDADSIFCS